MTREEMKQALAALNDSNTNDAEGYGEAIGEALGNFVTDAFDLGDRVLDELDGLWTAFKYTRSHRAGKFEAKAKAE